MNEWMNETIAIWMTLKVLADKVSHSFNIQLKRAEEWKEKDKCSRWPRCKQNTWHRQPIKAD